MTPRQPSSCLSLLFVVSSLACGDGTDTTLVEASSALLPADPIGDTAADPAEGAALQQGFSVVHTDYDTYGVSLLSASGEVVSADFISAAGAESGLSAPFSDLALPSMRTRREVVVINRSGAGFLTFVDLETSEVRAQLSVDTGFAANPHDYVPISDTKAYVPRHAPNFAAGREPFDDGSDLLIIDPSIPEVTGRIDLSDALGDESSQYFPRPSRALLARGLVRVSLLGYDEFFMDALDSRVVSVDPEDDGVSHVLLLEGMKNCGPLALSPDGGTIAVGCSGPFGVDPATGFPESGIVLLSVDDELVEVDRLRAEDLGGEMISSVSFVSDGTLAFTTYGRYNDDFSEQAAADTARLVDLDSGSLIGAPLHESQTAPFSLGQVACRPEAGTCMLADAETQGGALHAFSIQVDGSLDEPTTTIVDWGLGLPPRSFGAY